MNVLMLLLPFTSIHSNPSLHCADGQWKTFEWSPTQLSSANVVFFNDEIVPCGEHNRGLSDYSASNADSGSGGDSGSDTGIEADDGNTSSYPWLMALAIAAAVLVCCICLIVGCARRYFKNRTQNRARINPQKNTFVSRLIARRIKSPPSTDRYSHIKKGKYSHIVLRSASAPARRPLSAQESLQEIEMKRMRNRM